MLPQYPSETPVRRSAVRNAFRRKAFRVFRPTWNRLCASYLWLIRIVFDCILKHLSHCGMKSVWNVVLLLNRLFLTGTHQKCEFRTCRSNCLHIKNWIYDLNNSIIDIVNSNFWYAHTYRKFRIFLLQQHRRYSWVVYEEHVTARLSIEILHSSGSFCIRTCCAGAWSQVRCMRQAQLRSHALQNGSMLKCVKVASNVSTQFRSIIQHRLKIFCSSLHIYQRFL